MAVTVTIEFTDAQWALIETHYNNKDRALTSDNKAAELSSYIKEDVEANVLKRIRSAAADAQNNAFDV